MNLFRIPSILALCAALAAAGSAAGIAPAADSAKDTIVPPPPPPPPRMTYYLAEPISTRHTATTLRTVNATLHTGSQGQLATMHREKDQIVLDRLTKSDSILAKYPLITWYFPRVIDSGRILDIYPDDSSTRSISKYTRLGLDVGHGFPHAAEGGVRNAANELQSSAFVCDGHKVYGMFGYYQPLDSLILPEGSNCLLDGNGISYGWTLMWNSGKGQYAIRAGYEQRLTDKVLESELAADTLTWLVSTYHGWIAFDQKHGTFYRGKRTMRMSDRTISESIDSFPMPELASSNPTFYQPSISDDLLAFGLDSQLVLAKLTDTSIQILSKIAIPGSPVRATAISPARTGPAPSDAVLWASNGESLFSFLVKGSNLDSLEASKKPVSGSHPAPARQAGLEIVAHAHTARFHWNGTTPLPTRISRMDGRQIHSLTLLPGTTTSWKAPSPGLYLASTPVGTRVIATR